MMPRCTQRTSWITQNKNRVWWDAWCFLLCVGRYLRYLGFFTCHYLSGVSSPSQRFKWENVMQVCLLSQIITTWLLYTEWLPSVTERNKVENWCWIFDVPGKIINQDELWDKISLRPDKKSDWCFEKSFNPTKSELNGKLFNALSNRHI